MAQQYPTYAEASTPTDPQLQLPHLAALSHNSYYAQPPYPDPQLAAPEPYRPAPQIPQMLDHVNVSQDIDEERALQNSRKEPGTRGSNRLRKACDSCSIRKVKCDEAGPPCRACSALEIPCTYERPSRRRGPPNRHAEAIKRQRLEESQQGSPMPMADAPASPAYPALNLAPNQAPSGLSAESIAPIELIDAFIDDFFTYAHPLTPFPHEPSFRAAWAQRKDRQDRFFLALLAGMIGGLVSMFPRRPQKHLKALGKEALFPNTSALVDVCRAVCLEARGAGYLEREGLYVYDAATSYFLLIMSTFMYRWQAADMYIGECFTIIRASGFYTARPSYPPADYGARAALSTEQDMNFIDEEVGRRVFWTIYVTVRSARAFGAQLGDMPIQPPTPVQGYPPLPMEVDDKYIHGTHFERQPHDVVSKMAGFNANARIYLTHNPLVAMESSYAIDSIFDREKQKRVLMDCYSRVKHALDDAPAPLLVWPTYSSRSPSSTTSAKTDINTSTLHENHSHPVVPQAQMSFLSALQNSAEECRQIAYEIQKANIHISALSSRSFFLEKYWVLCEQFQAPRDPKSRQQAAQTASSPADNVFSPSAFANRPSGAAASSEDDLRQVREERESIARDLLDVLSKIRPIHMEPNSVSFCMKIRQIASTLLPMEGDISRLPDDALSAKYLRPVLDILMEVEKSGQPSHEEDDEEAELRRWTGLRDFQKELVERKNTIGVVMGRS